jgi:hypothetical protein
MAGPRHRQPQSPPLFSSGFCYGLILFAHAAADLKRLYHVTIALERDAPGGDHHLAVIQGVDAEKWPARLGIRGENLGDEIEGLCGTRILQFEMPPSMDILEVIRRLGSAPCHRASSISSM